MAAAEAVIEQLIEYSKMGKPRQDIKLPSWLKDLQSVRHIKGNIWEIELTGYGRTLVGPYSELDRHLRTQGLAEDAHHIVGKEHLEVIRTRYTERNAPSVALERRLHNELVTPQIGEGQKHLGGRRTKRWERPSATRTEIAELYRDVYTYQTRFRELAIIAEDILEVQTPPSGSATPPERGRIPPVSRATENDSRAVSDKKTESRTASVRGRKSRPVTQLLQSLSAPRTASSLPQDVPDIRTGAGRLAEQAQRLNKFRIGFGADLLIQIATELMLGILESKLSTVNEEGIQKAYKGLVYNTILKPKVDETVKQVREGSFSAKAEKKSKGLSKKWLYLEYSYDVIMEPQKEDLTDVLISILRQGYVEVFHSIVPENYMRVATESRPLPDREVIKRKERKKIGGFYHYPYTHRLLLWDPEAAKIFYKLRAEQSNLLGLVDEVREKSPLFFSKLRKFIEEYQFLTAYHMLVNDPSVPRSFPKLPNLHSVDLKKLREALVKAQGLLAMPFAWSEEDRRTILTLYLGDNPFGYVKEKPQRQTYEIPKAELRVF